MTVSSGADRRIPLALYYIKAYFEKKCAHKTPRVKVSINSFSSADTVDAIINKILAEKPDILGLSCYAWNIKKILDVAGIIKKKKPLIKIILGGPEVSPRAREILKKEVSIDIVVRGEGEEAFSRLMESFIYGKIGLQSIPGISYRGAKKIVTNSRMPLLENMDLIPSPYLSGLIDIKNVSEVPYETMRGCPFRCHFCYEHKDYDKIRFFSLGRVAGDLKFILSRKPPSMFIFDSTFNADPQRAKDVLRLFIKYNKVTKLRLAIKAELLDEEMIELMSRAGVYVLEVGIQTINARTLKTVNRTMQKNIFKKNIRLLRLKRVPFELQLVALLPHDTYESLKRSVDWVCDLHPSGVAIYNFTVLPGTYLRQHAKTYGIKYRRAAPYCAYQSNAVSQEDCKKIVQLRSALDTCYNSGAIRKTLYAVKSKLGVPFSRFFEDWSRWERAFCNSHKRLFRGKLNADRLDELVRAAPEFLFSLCGRYKRPSVYDSLYRILRVDIMNFIAALEVLKHKKGVVID